MSQSTPPPVSPVQEDKVSFVEAIRQYISGVVDLRQGVNVLATIREIKQRKSMEGANAWMLMCSIVIASIGLSQNSQAVIIGAMLISPLMSPILGIGLSVGINDMETLRSSAIHFGIAILIAVFTSTIYFALTPFDSLTPEIEARTAPTFLDIFIAIFGGLAGIISVARKDVSTTLPGVAIATALMPPLCVTGFGIATGSWEVATRSFYLFFLNTFFVALATYVIVRMLKFPQKRYVDQKRARSGHIYVILFALALTIPSFFIFRGVIKDLRTKLSLQRFVTTCLQEDKVYLDNYQLENNPDGTSTLLLKVYGNVINEENLSEYESCLANLGV
ncbi:MAG: TIGR00341 family protein, partial [Bacteroidota bacterium]